PAAGVVLPGGALFLGAASSVICFFALELKNKLGYDDSLDCFGIHGVGSGFGVLALSFFIRDSWMKAASVKAGTEWTGFSQFLVQLKGMGAVILLSALATYIICFIIQKTIGFRLSRSEELAGLDHSEHSESGYGLINLN
ncbi:MAG TPA: ammonia channel protein, partial [Leptospiraceae bacterium]|nr:ammonia channel protein [Leptospiraceae bacterium]